MSQNKEVFLSPKTLNLLSFNNLSRRSSSAKSAISVILAFDIFLLTLEILLVFSTAVCKSVMKVLESEPFSLIILNL